MVMSQERARAVVESGRKRVAYGMDNKSFGEFILSERMRDVTAEVAHAIRDTAQEIAVRDEGNDRRPRKRTEHYADAFEVEREGGTMRVDRALRVVVLVKNDDPVAAINEWGAGRTPRRRTLGRAGAMHGDFKPDGGPE